MFKRSFRSQDPSRVDKTARVKKPSSSRDASKLSKLQRTLADGVAAKNNPRHHPVGGTPAPSPKPLGLSAIVTLTVGRDGRLFAAHEDVLCQAPFFEAVCRGGKGGLSPTPLSSHASPTLAPSRRISLPDEEPEIMSAILEFLYKGDYYPRLLHNRVRDSWHLEDAAAGSSKSPRPSSASIADNHKACVAENPEAGRPTAGSPDATVAMPGVDGHHVLRDTAIYCAAERFGLDELKRLALRKQGLQSGVDVATILRSARYAYAHTPDSDSRLRAHYLALIIRCRKTFKRSGTMQSEMEHGESKLFFDLFVALCNHLDDVIDASNSRSPKLL